MTSSKNAEKQPLLTGTFVEHIQIIEIHKKIVRTINPCPRKIHFVIRVLPKT